MDINWQTPHPSVTEMVRAGIEAHKATQNALGDGGFLPHTAVVDAWTNAIKRNQHVAIGQPPEVVEWLRKYAGLPDDGVTYVVEGESRV